MLRAALIALLLLQQGPPPAPGGDAGARPAQEKPPEAPPPAAKVVAAVAKAARGNAALPEKERLAGDDLGDLYVRGAAAAADGDAAAFLVGLAHALDPKGVLARHPVTAAAFRDLETEEEGKARRDSLGRPALRGRGDWLLHLATSAAVAALLGPAAAETTGVGKEISDMAPGGTGFSFADLLADIAGIRLAAWVKADPKARLERLAKGYRGADFLPDPKQEPEGLGREAFAKEFGSVSDDRFRAKVKALRAAVAALAVYGEPAAGKPAEGGK